jgi:hypothetical protein
VGGGGRHPISLGVGKKKKGKRKSEKMLKKSKLGDILRENGK